MVFVAEMEAEHAQTLMQEARGHKISCFLCSLPFSDHLEDDLKTRVLNSCIHHPDDNSVKFAVAAVIEKTGISFVCCIWVYIACIREL